jgi:serine/threonine protein kinase
MLDELMVRWEELAEAGDKPLLADLCRDCPHLLPEVERRVAALKALGWMAGLQPAVERRVVPGYRLLARLSKGGFGEVFKARAPDGRLVALKVVEPADEKAASELRTLERLTTLRHPNVITILAAWQDGGALFVARELADGSLHERLLRSGGAGIPRDEILRHVRGAAAGIDALHAHGLTHRDVKPSNLLLVGEEVAGRVVEKLGWDRAVVLSLEFCSSCLLRGVRVVCMGRTAFSAYGRRSCHSSSARSVRRRSPTSPRHALTAAIPSRPAQSAG